MPGDTEITPRHVLCAIGEWTDFADIEELVGRFSGFTLDREFSQLRPDERMARAFEASYDRVDVSMTGEDWQAVERHTAVAYVLSPPVPKESALAVSGKALLLAAGLLRAGALAVKGESSGIAHGADAWGKLATNFIGQAEARDEHGMWSTLVRAWVRRPILDDERGLYYSCGLHLLGAPDVEIDSEMPVEEALEWMDLLALYLTADQPERPIRSGEGFRLTDDSPRKILQRYPDKRAGADDFMFNPYGLLRLQADD